jgi:hypothetical protein
VNRSKKKTDPEAGKGLSASDVEKIASETAAKDAGAPVVNFLHKVSLKLDNIMHRWSTSCTGGQLPA